MGRPPGARGAAALDRMPAAPAGRWNPARGAVTVKALRPESPPGAGPGGQHNGLEDFLASVELRAFRIARRAIWDDDAALDIVQDSMLKLFEKYAKRPATEWPALFYTILGNRIRDARRWRMLHHHVERLASRFTIRDGGGGAEGPDFLGQLADPAPGDRDPEAAETNRQLRGAMEAAVSDLSERQRQVFVMREWEGMNVKETAAVLGCSEGSVKQHHFRAMRALRAKLGEVWANE